METLRKEKNVAVTSTTGKSASNYGDLNATTLHYWAGLSDGHLSKEQLVKRASLDNNAAKRICQSEVLVIDEIGMLSATLFEKVEYVCRKVRKNASYFGGLQVIAAGDFRQLMPVPDYLYGDEGNPCYTWQGFYSVFPHRINLTEVCFVY